MIWVSLNMKLRRSITESILLPGEIQFCHLYQNISKGRMSNFSTFCLFFITFDEILNIFCGFPLELDPVTQQLMLQTAKPTFGHLTDVSKTFKL